MGHLYYIHTIRMPLLVELRKSNGRLDLNDFGGILATMKVRTLLIENVVQAQLMDKEAEKMHEKKWKEVGVNLCRQRNFKI